MSTVAVVVLVAAIVFFLGLIGALFGVVWFAGRNGRRAQLRG
jgi:hypothetical protein